MSTNIKENNLSKEDNQPLENDLEEEEEENNLSKDQEEDEEEDKEEEIIDLDEINEDQADPNKLNNTKETNAVENLTNDKENLNTQFTGSVESVVGRNQSDKRLDSLNLQNLDVKIFPKEEILNFLMNNKEIFGSCSSVNLDTLNIPVKSEKKTNKKYKNIESSFKQTRIKPNYMLSNSMNDPEMTYDFNTAWNRVIKRVVDNKIEDKSLKLLVSKKNIEKSRNLESAKRENISTKVDFYINKKTKTVEGMKDKIAEEFNQNHTFRPVTNNPVQADKQRNLEEFLSFQNNHLKKVGELVKGMKEERESKNLELITNPMIDKVSIKIFEEKIRTNDPTFLRLYKKHFELKKKEESSKIEKKRTDETDERINKLYNDEFAKQKKIKELGEKQDNIAITEVNSLISSNKIVLNKFQMQYNKEINNIEKTNDNAVLTKLNLMQFYSLFLRLKFISKEFEKYFLNNSENSSPSNNNDLLLNLNESKLKFTEKKLVQEIWENLKDNEGLVDKNNLYLFLLSVVNLYDYHLIKKNKKNFNEKIILSELLKSEIKDEELSSMIKSRKKEINQYILAKVNEEILSKIKTSKKYVGFDENNSLYISNKMSDNIHKDFNFLSINNSNANHVFSNKDKNQKTIMTFRPTTNPNSDKLSSNFRRKIQIDMSESNMDISDKIKSSNTKNKQSNIIERDIQQINDNKFNINYIKLLLIKKKKREKLMAKKREETESKELVECSFNPKINTDFPLEQSRNDRFEHLYRIGKEQLTNKSDKKKEDIEKEKNEKECTHKPNVTNLNIDFSLNQSHLDNDRYQSYFDRIKKARHEKLIKDQVQTREPFSKIEELERNENKIQQEKREKREKKAISQEHSKEEKNLNSGRSNKEKKVEMEGLSMNLKAFNKKEEEKKEEKKVIPLLIIDVNLRPGEKKKIYVFDGDTAEGLAEKFSKEHSLDIETRNKLKVLIQSHMSKLLMRIEEENQSINSEKSSSNIFQ